MTTAELIALLENTAPEPLLKVLRELQQIEEAYPNGRPSIIKKFTRVSEIIAAMGKRAPIPEPLQQWQHDYQQRLTDGVSRARERFGAELDDKLRPLGLRLSGGLPLLRAGFFTIEADKDGAMATLWYGHQQERLSRLTLDPDKVKDQIEKQLKELGSGLAFEEFKDTIIRAYRRVERHQGEEGAPIIKVLVEMAFLLQKPAFQEDPRREYYTEYNRADFSYDLHRYRELLVKQGISLRTAARAYDKRNAYLWVPEGEDGQGGRFAHLVVRGE